MARDRDNLRKMIRELGFGSIEDYLMRHARPSIRVYTKPVEDETQIPIGASKIGGRPDLPKDMNWIKVGTDKQGSLPFIAQFNLKDVKQYDEENLLPSDGILYFFADPFGDSGRAVFVDDSLLLERKPFPDDVPMNKPQEWGERYDPCSLEFIPEVNLPFQDASWTEPEDYQNDKTWEEFFELKYSASYTHPSPPHNRTVNRLLGYNYDLPEDMQLDCELITEYGSLYNSSKELREKSDTDKREWQLLFQMDSDVNAGMMWSDAGYLCFYIRRRDLAARNFADICVLAFSG